MSSPVDTPPNPFDGFTARPSHGTPAVENLAHDAGGVVASSADSSQPGRAGGRRREKKRVGFTGEPDSGDRSPRTVTTDGPSPGATGTLSPPHVTPPYTSPDTSGPTTPVQSRQASIDIARSDDPSRSHLPALSPQQTREIHAAFSHTLAAPRPRPAIRRSSTNHAVDALQDVDLDGRDDDGQRAHRAMRQRDAHERAKRLETDERRSLPNSRFNSPERNTARGLRKPQQPAIEMDDLDPKNDGADDSDTDDGLEIASSNRLRRAATAEALNLVRKHTVIQDGLRQADTPPSPGIASGAVTPTEETQGYEFYQPRPQEYRGGILSSLLKLHHHQQQYASTGRSSSRQPTHRRGWSGEFSNATTPTHSPPDSGTTTPTGSHWFSRKARNHSTSSLAKLIGSSAQLSSPAVSGLGEEVARRLKQHQEQERKHAGIGKRSRSSDMLSAFHRPSRPHMEEEIKITVHIAEYIARQKYLLRLCRGLMEYGAPTHRLEEYMNMSARVLEIQAQFLYIPGSMIMSFDDPSTHTTEVKLVKVTQGLDLGKLRDVHEVYKDVVHDRIGVEEATARLKEIKEKPPKHSRMLRIPMYGLAAVCVGPFAFGARLIDLPIAFLLGCILGVLQLVVSPKSDLYANVFEIAATVITSFLARAFGSIPDGRGGRIFCFAALAQSSIALILPGYIVLCASLELQSRAIVAGSIRMVYAIIYSLFLGFGITIGTAIYGIMDRNATSETTCATPMQEPYFFPFVPAFAMCLIVINQAKWKQAPVMLIIAFTGYLVNYYSSKRFAGNTQVSNTLGALVIGVLANLYSRVGGRIENWLFDVWEDTLRPYWKAFKRNGIHINHAQPRKSAQALEEGRAGSGKDTGEAESVFVRQTRRVGYGLAAAAMLPAIFVQVPSGLAVSGSLVAGLASANQIAGNATNGTTVVNSTTLADGSNALNSIAFNVSYSVIQVAIGITVGLFLSAIVVYPLGKKRSGLFSF